MPNVIIGQKAPDFTLVGTDLQPLTLSDFSGNNLILHFFPLAFTSVCTAQMCTANEQENDYASLDAEVVGVSVDSPFVHKKFAEEYDLRFKLGSDFNRKVSSDYGVLFEEDFAGMTHFSRRAAFIIDKEGIIQYAETVTDGKSLPNFEKIKETLKKLNK